MGLRFGLMPLEFRPILDRIMVSGIPDFSRFNIVDIVRDCVKAGYELIEVSMDLEYILPDSLAEDKIDKLVDLKEEFGHSYTVHLPLWSVEPASFNENIRSASVNTIVSAIKRAERLEPEAYVYHATGSLAAEFSRLDVPVNILNIINGYMLSYASASVEEVLAASEINPRILAVENVEFPFTLTREMIDEYDLGICFDTGHLLTRYSGEESVIEFYKKHRDIIIEIHLHDGSYEECNGMPVHRDHVALGEGDMPIDEFISLLLKDDFSRPIIFEISKNEADLSLDRIRELVPEAHK